ncbi:MAG TPA: hypothetical protein VJA85_09515 [Candidatus Limnocylindria bacterium]|nr:hypothetical protein [Candidatus Limnocylindria bacterium]
MSLSTLSVRTRAVCSGDGAKRIWWRVVVGVGPPNSWSATT